MLLAVMVFNRSEVLFLTLLKISCYFLLLRTVFPAGGMPLVLLLQSCDIMADYQQIERPGCV